MSQFSDLVSKAARDAGSLPFFATGQAQADAHLIKLDSNENPFGPSPRALEAMRVALASAHIYPNDDCLELRRRLAGAHRVQPEQVLITPGSTGMLSLLCQTLLTPGRNAVTSERSFIVYGMVVRASGARLIEAPMKGDEFDLAAIRKAINPDTRIVFLANPNNPTGTIIDASSLDRFLGDVPEHVVVVLDEAYYEFALRLAEMQKMQYPQSLAYVRRSSRVVVLRTFSKVHGLAGLRIGCGLGPAELLGYCGRMANTYSISSIAQLAALAALEDREHIERTVTNNAEQAEVLHKALAELGFRVVPTCANFIYCDLGQDAARFALRLQAEGLSVRPLGAWGSARCIRVSIATPEQNQSFLEGAAKIRDSRE